MPAVLLPRAAGFLRRPQITHFVPSAAAQTSVRRFFRFIRHPTSYICCSYFSRKAARLRCGLIYHSRAPAHFFCAIDISVIFRPTPALCTPAAGTCSAFSQAQDANVYRIIANFAVLSILCPRFLCNLLKYTCCTVFRPKFIHFSNGVKSGSGNRAIFVCF